MVYTLDTREQRPRCTVIPTRKEESSAERGELDPRLPACRRRRGRHGSRGDVIWWETLSLGCLDHLQMLADAFSISCSRSRRSRSLV